MPIAARLGTGEIAELLAIERHDQLALVSPRSFAPGAPFSMDVDLAPDRTLVVSCKVIAIKRREDGRFDVRGRAVALRRADREAIAVALSVAT